MIKETDPVKLTALLEEAVKVIFCFSGKDRCETCGGYGKINGYYAGMGCMMGGETCPACKGIGAYQKAEMLMKKLGISFP